MKTTFFSTLIGCTLLFFSCKKANNQTENKALQTSYSNLKEVLEREKADILDLKNTLEKAFPLAEKLVNTSHDSLIAAVCRLLGNKYIQAEKQDTARYYLKKGLAFGQRHLSNQSELILRLYHNVGITYYNQDDFNNAIVYFDSLKIVQKSAVFLTIKAHNTYRLAICNKNLKNYKGAAIFFQEALALTNSYLPVQKRVEVYRDYSESLQLLKKYSESIAIAEEGQRLAEDFRKTGKQFGKKDSIALVGCYFNAAYAYQDSGLYAQAEINYQKALPIYEKFNDIDNITLSHMNLGGLYRISKQTEKAETTLSEGIKLLQKQPQLTNFLVVQMGKLYVNRSETYMDRQQYDHAIADHDSAIKYLTRYDENPILDGLLLNSRQDLLSVLSDKARAYMLLEKKSNFTEGSQKALTIFDQIIDLVEDMRVDLMSDDAKRDLTDDSKGAFEKALELCYDLYQSKKQGVYAHKAFAFAEQSRSRALFENVQLDSRLPADLQTERLALKQKEAQLVGEKTNDIDFFQAYLHDKRLFREKIKSYSRNKTVAIPTVQRQLLSDNRTALLEYFVGDSAIYLLSLTADNVQFYKFPKGVGFDKQVLALRQSIVNQENNTFLTLSSQLYADILRGAIEDLPKNIDRLIVAPDGVLNFVPFDVLPQTTPSVSDLKNVDFLLQHYTVSYAPSADLRVEQSKRVPKAVRLAAFSAFAPRYNSRDTLNEIVAMRGDLVRGKVYDLPKAAEEVKGIQALVGGNIYQNDDASKQSFVKNAPNLPILHLAMHAVTDDQNPMQSRLLFTKNPKDTTQSGDLTAAELYTMTLTADLVVLSACNTGFGKLSRGEGVMNLGRAFNYAGVPSSVVSLWKVPDDETSSLMIDFYKHLKAGQNKDAALRAAKIAYLSKVRFNDKAAPLYWSAFVVSGNTAPLQFNTPLSIWAVLVGLWLFIGLILWLKAKKKFKT